MTAVVNCPLAAAPDSTAITDSALVLPYLAIAACGTAIAVYMTRIPRGTA